MNLQNITLSLGDLVAYSMLQRQFFFIFVQIFGIMKKAILSSAETAQRQGTKNRWILRPAIKSTDSEPVYCIIVCCIFQSLRMVQALNAVQ